MVYEKMPDKIDGLGLEKFPCVIGKNEYVMYGYDCYKSYFGFAIDLDGKSICAEVYDHDEGCCREFETLFEYEGDDFEEWETDIEEFEQHQKEWKLWKEFVNMYNS